MKKDVEWLKEKVEEMYTHYSISNNFDFVSKREAITEISNLIDQLDEPEVLSQEWIERNTSPVDDEGRLYIWKRDLQNIIIPKQEEVDQAYKDGYEKGKKYTFYKGYLEGLVDKENEPETVASVTKEEHIKSHVFEPDIVNRPTHYQGIDGLEVEDVLRNFIPRYTDPYVGHRIASAIEYLLRSPLKNGQQDIEKARKNLDQALGYMEEKEE